MQVQKEKLCLQFLQQQQQRARHIKKTGDIMSFLVPHLGLPILNTKKKKDRRQEKRERSKQ
jgi:hypothetical protein